MPEQELTWIYFRSSLCNQAMATSRDVKKRVGHGGMCTFRKKLARTRSTGLVPSSAILLAAQGMEKTERASRLTASVVAMSTSMGVFRPRGQGVYGSHGCLRVLDFNANPGVPNEMDDSVGFQLNDAFTAVDVDRILGLTLPHALMLLAGLILRSLRLRQDR